MSAPLSVLPPLHNWILCTKYILYTVHKNKDLVPIFRCRTCSIPPSSIDPNLISPGYVDFVNGVIWPNSLTNENRDTAICLICCFILIDKLSSGLHLFYLLIPRQEYPSQGLSSSLFFPSQLEIGNTIGGQRILQNTNWPHQWEQNKGS